MLAARPAAGDVAAQRLHAQERVEVETAEAPAWLRSRRSRSASKGCSTSGRPIASAAEAAARQGDPASSQAIAAAVKTSWKTLRKVLATSSGPSRSLCTLWQRSAMSELSRLAR